MFASISSHAPVGRMNVEQRKMKITRIPWKRPSTHNIDYEKHFNKSSSSSSSSSSLPVNGKPFRLLRHNIIRGYRLFVIVYRGRIVNIRACNGIRTGGHSKYGIRVIIVWKVEFEERALVSIRPDGVVTYRLWLGKGVYASVINHNARRAKTRRTPVFVFFRRRDKDKSPYKLNAAALLYAWRAPDDFQ